MTIDAADFARVMAPVRELLPGYRQAWFGHLFRHEPIENAISVLRSGLLASRNSALAQGLIINDIAPEDIIGNRVDAHDYARLYFRPRNPTQYHIEGIRKPSEYYQGKHGGFIVMFVFDAASVLGLPGARFSCGNMQSPWSQIMETTNDFEALDFASIYHDSAYPGDEVRRKRCAEVLVPEQLPLLPHLRHIVVRTDANVATVKHAISDVGSLVPLDIVRRTMSSGVFFQRHAALDFVDASPGRINFKLTYTESPDPLQVQILVSSRAGAELQRLETQLEKNKKYYWEHGVRPGDYILDVWIEGSLAHRSGITLS